MIQTKNKSNRTAMTDKLWSLLGRETRDARNSIIKKIDDAVRMPLTVIKEVDDLILKMHGLTENLYSDSKYDGKCAECGKKVDWYECVHMNSFSVGSYVWSSWTISLDKISIGFCNRICLRKFVLKEIDRMLDLTDETDRKAREIK